MSAAVSAEAGQGQKTCFKSSLFGLCCLPEVKHDMKSRLQMNHDMQTRTRTETSHKIEKLLRYMKSKSETHASASCYLALAI